MDCWNAGRSFGLLGHFLGEARDNDKNPGRCRRWLLAAADEAVIVAKSSAGKTAKKAQKLTKEIQKLAAEKKPAGTKIIELRKKSVDLKNDSMYDCNATRY
jgi:hypothetical protein